jgi:hypothetical protein
LLCPSLGWGVRSPRLDMWPQLRNGIQRYQQLLELALRVRGEERRQRMRLRLILALCGMSFRR